MTPSEMLSNNNFAAVQASLTATLLCLISSCALSAEREDLDRVIPQVEKPSAIASILRRHSLTRALGNTAEDPFCTDLKRALEGGTGTTFIAPDFETTDPKDPRLHRYQHCFDYSMWSPDTAYRRFSGPGSVGDQKFALFSLSHAIGFQSKELLYAENSDENRGLDFHGGYFSINIEECLIDTVASIQQSFTRKDRPLKTSSFYDLNALVYHEGAYAVLELHVLREPRHADEEPLYTLKVYKYMPEDKFKQSCNWLEPVDRLKK